MQLTDSQSRALCTVLERIDEGAPLLSISGAAGTGKTTLLTQVRDNAGGDVTVCTPTNKAAQVLQMKGIDAATFFKRFYILEEKPRFGTKPKFISCQSFLRNHPKVIREGGHWRDYEYLLPEGKRAWADVLIVDEASMVTSRRAAEMQRMCRTLVLVGDHNQLPPVDDQDFPGGYFGALQHTTELTEIMRQAEGSLILELASEIRNKGPRADALLRAMQPLEDQSFEDLINDGTQVLAFTNKERQRINHLARRILGFNKPTPMPGDRIVVTNNSSDVLINGTTATVEHFDWNGHGDLADIILQLDSGERVVTVMSMRTFVEDQVSSAQAELCRNYDPPPRDSEEELRLELTWAYCLTAHKAQGSEWPSVVVIDQRGLIRKVQASSNRPGGLHPDEYARRWIYTCVTRARENLVVTHPWFAAINAQA